MTLQTNNNPIILISTLFLLVGCADLDETTDTEMESVSQSLIIEGSAEAVGMLHFLNDEATTFDILDIDARLDARAARGIIHHRNGPDAVYATWDDNLFDSIEEVDSVSWVGEAMLGRILDFTYGSGYVPTHSDILGIYDNVTFTVDESFIVLDYVNQTDYETLDFFLNRRAVDSIMAARPVDSLEQLSGLYYVGESALSLLKETVSIEQQ